MDLSQLHEAFVMRSSTRNSDLKRPRQSFLRRYLMTCGDVGILNSPLFASHASNLAQPLFLTGGIFLAEGAEMLIMGWHPGFLLWFGIEGRIVEPRFHHLASTSALGPQPCHSWWHGFHSCLASVDLCDGFTFCFGSLISNIESIENKNRT